MLEATTLTLLGVLVTAPAAKDTSPGVILLHAAYGTPHSFHITGRVLEDRGVRGADPERGKLANTVDTVKAMKSHEVVDAVVEVELLGRRFVGETDREGDFAIETHELDPALPDGWLATRVRLRDDRGHPAPEVQGRLLIVPDEPGIGLISDLDDTVIDSGVSDKAKLLLHTLTVNAAQLRAVPGVPDAYREAERAGVRAFFYVSGSPENLHERIYEFLELQKIPVGPIILKNFRTEPLGEQQEYKRRHINAIMAALPQLNFLCVGDSGEKDPEIYRRAMLEHPGRVLGVVIRRVQGADNSAARLAGMLAVDDFDGNSELLATLVTAAKSTPARSYEARPSSP